MEHQLPPEGDWRTWVILGGRGAGKTRAGSEWIRQMVEGSRPKMPGRCARVALVGETLDQAREVMVFGESGILACAPPDRWSYFVLLDGTLEQIELAASGRNTLQYFQIGPAARPYSDYSYRKLSAAFAGNGLRPYAPVHLAQKWDGADLEFSWIRRALGWGILGFGRDPPVRNAGALSGKNILRRPAATPRRGPSSAMAL